MNHIFEEFFSNRILCCFSKNFYLEPVIVSLLIEFSVASFPKIFVSRLLLFPYRIFSCCFSENFSRAFVVVSSFVEFQFHHNKLTSYNKLIFFLAKPQGPVQCKYRRTLQQCGRRVAASQLDRDFFWGVSIDHMQSIVFSL